MSGPGPGGRPGGPSYEARQWLGLCLFLGATTATFLTASDYGIASDVGNYFYGSLRQLAWLRELWGALLEGRPEAALATDPVFEHWRWYIERIPHPPLSRELGGLGWLAMGSFLDPLTAYRTAVMLVFGALTASVGVYTASRTESMAAGIAAGLSVLGVPALFAHGHLAHTDLFLAAFWFWSVASLDTAVRKGGSGWFLLSGLFLGAALATKFTGLLLVPVLAVWLATHRGGVAALLALLLAAFLVFVAVNPVMWVDPVQGLTDYARAGLDRADAAATRIVTLYFGQLYAYRPPWHYPYVWTAIVLPLPLLASVLAGLLAPRSGGLRGLVLLNMAVLYGALALPSAPMHDGIRLFLPVFPLYAVAAGAGALAIGEWLARRIAGRWPRLEARRDLVVAATVVGLLAVPLFRTAQSHPHQLSYVNALVGGVRGAQARGLEVTNLKEVLNRAALQDLASIIPGDAVVDAGFFLEEMCFYQAVGWAPRSWRLEVQLTKADGTPDVSLACEGPESFVTVALDRPAREADYVFVLNRRGQWRPLELALFEHGGQPLYEVSTRGVPLMRVYRTR